MNTSPAPTDPRESHAVTFRAWAKAISDRDLEAYMACFSPDIIIEDIALNRTISGLVELRQLAGVWFAAFEDTTLTLQLHLEGDGHAAVSWESTGTVRGHFPGVTDNAVDGGRFRKRGMSVFRFDQNSKFVWERSHWDLQEFQRGLGVSVDRPG